MNEIKAGVRKAPPDYVNYAQGMTFVPQNRLQAPFDKLEGGDA